MTGIAGLLIVRPFEIEIADIVQGLDVREGLGSMTSRAIGPKFALMYLGFRMTGTTAEAVPRSGLKGHTGVTIRALHCEMLSGQFVVTLNIVIEGVFTGFQVTAIALVAQAIFVHIVFGVAALGRTILWGP